jgi:hypothetical protein
MRAVAASACIGLSSRLALSDTMADGTRKNRLAQLRQPGIAETSRMRRKTMHILDRQPVEIAH